ncbi:MAG: D-glycero-beta-D-manno-heptose-7-phosphate kinase [Holosporales bacterium]|nr:D-glycero-beta-D-manno-heptose-7-phosphate kinase [Holosporales bacterium]
MTLPFEKAKILCVGDLLLDRYITGSARRLSPEAPVPVVSMDATRNALGGAANVAHNIASAGAQCTLVGVLGQDAAAGALKEALTSVANITPLCLSSSTRTTPVKTRVMVGQHQLVRLDEEKTDPLTPSLAAEVYKVVAAQIKQHNLVVLSDYNKGTLPPTLTTQMIAEAQRQEKRVLVDPKGDSYEKYRGAFLLTPNLKEFSEVFGLHADLGEVCQRAQQALAEYDWQAILLTCSEAGMRLITREKVAAVSATQQEVFDVSGAGDTAMAYFSVAIAMGLALEESMTFANDAAGCAVRKSGTAVVSWEEVCTASGDFSLKRVSLEEASKKVCTWRQLGQKIGFTNGCFDVLHPGHLATLRTARTHCDRLIVGLNTDLSVRRLKGPSRPLQNENTRAEILAALQDVDLVVLFDTLSPKELIEVLQPDVLVKGAEYRIENLSGAQEILDRGGQVILADMKPGFSTSHFIEERFLLEQREEVDGTQRKRKSS